MRKSNCPITFIFATKLRKTFLMLIWKLAGKIGGGVRENWRIEPWIFFLSSFICAPHSELNLMQILDLLEISNSNLLFLWKKKKTVNFYRWGSRTFVLILTGILYFFMISSLLRKKKHRIVTWFANDLNIFARIQQESSGGSSNLNYSNYTPGVSANLTTLNNLNVAGDTRVLHFENYFST